MTSREAFIAANLQGIGLESFPEDSGVAWQLCSARHEGDYSLVEAEPRPATVGYPRFRFVLHFDALGRGTCVGCYALDAGRWDLLFTTPGAPTDWQRLFS